MRSQSEVQKDTEKAKLKDLEDYKKYKLDEKSCLTFYKKENSHLQIDKLCAS